MEDDDEFGDLYTDVLQPFASSSLSSATQSHQVSPAPPSLHRPIDLNLQSDDDGIVFGAPHSNSIASNQTLAPQPTESIRDSTLAAKPDLALNSIGRDERGEDSAGGARVLEEGDVELLKKPPEEDVSFGGVDEGLNRGGEGAVDVKFDIEESNTGIDDDIGSEPIIPGLSAGGAAMVRGGSPANLEAASRKDDGSGVGGSGDNEWDSDSDDDLQIVLNDNNHGPMAMERGGIGGEEDDDDDEDGDPLVIVADGEMNQEIETQEWGEDAAQAADGERKETGEAGKVIGGAGHAGVVMPPKIGYSNHGYHPFHSQFKVSVLYVVA